MVALDQHRSDLDGYGAILGVMHGGDGTLLSMIRLYGMNVISRKALDMYRSSIAHISLKSAYNTMGTKGTPE